MSENLSSDDILRKYQQVFPNQTAELFHYLSNDVANLYLDWKNYCSLYGTSQERIDLLNQTAQSFFYRMRIIFWRDILARIMRLMDGSTSMGKSNASLKKLLDDLKNDRDGAFWSDLKSDYEEIEKITRKIKNLRNKKNFSCGLFNLCFA